MVESFDHDENYFGCKAYLYLGDIPFFKSNAGLGI